MPVENNTQNQQSLSNTLAGSLVQTAKTAAAGAAIGAVGGKAVSTVAPVSHRQIASQIIDTYVSNNKNGFADLTKNLEKAQYKNYVENAIKKVDEIKPENFKNEISGLKNTLQNLAVDANADKGNILSSLKKLIANNDADTSEAGIKALMDKIEDVGKTLADEATGKVETFFKQPRETIKKLKKGLKQELKKGADLGEKYDVLYAKKCAKKLQSHKIMGVAIAAGVMSALFANLFGVIGSGKKGQKAQEGQMANMAPAPQQPLGTTQG